MEILVFLCLLCAMVALIVAASSSGKASQLKQRVQMFELSFHAQQAAAFALSQRVAYLEFLATPLWEEDQRRKAGQPPRDIFQPASLPVPVPEPEPEGQAQPEPERALQPGAAPLATPPAEPVSEMVSDQTDTPASEEAGSEAAPLAEPVPPHLKERPVAQAPTADLGDAGTKPSLEQWLGVRGAAALGAGLLVLAGMYFFKYSLDQGLIRPLMRVVLGVIVGVGCITGGELVVRKRHALLAGCLSGAGIAILYLSAWASFALYQLVGQLPAWSAMVVITMGCCMLSFKRRSAPIAIMGLLGGFATPIMLSTGSDRPIALFSYLLVLDGALLFVAHKRRWPALALLSLLGTVAYEGLWIGTRMAGGQLFIGMTIVMIFGVLFAGYSQHAKKGDSASELWNWTLIGSTFLPFLFALYFGLQSDFGLELYQGGAYLALLVIGSSWLAAREQSTAKWLGVAAGCSALGVFAAWLLRLDLDATRAWEAMGVALGMALVLGCFAHLEQRKHTEDQRRPAAVALTVWVLGMLAVTAVAAAMAGTIVWPWLVGWLLLSAIGLVQPLVARDRGELETLLIALFSGVALTLLAGAVMLHPDSSVASQQTALLGALVHAVVFAAFGHVGGTFAKRHASDEMVRNIHLGSAGHAVILLFVPVAYAELQLGWQLSYLLVLTGLSAVAARRTHPGWLGGASALAMLGVWGCAEFAHPSDALWCLGALALVAVGAVVWPFATAATLRKRASTWRVASVAPLLMFAPLFSPTWNVPTAWLTSFALLLCVLAAVAARRTAAGWLLGAVSLTLLTLWGASFGDVRSQRELLISYAALVAVAVVGCVWPFLAPTERRRELWTWRTAALTPLLAFLPLLDIHTSAFGDVARGVVPIVLASMLAAALVALRKFAPADPATNRSVQTWLGGAALALAVVAVPLELEHQWWTIAWALQGVALLAWWRRLDHPGLKYVGVLMLSAAFIRLCGNPWLFEYHPRGLPVLNWLAYTFLVPTGCMLVGWRLLADRECQRLREWENEFPRHYAFAARTMALLGLITAFMWINLTIFDAFSTTRMLELSFERLPARDLTLSLAWALYAVGLLAIGMWRGITSLRQLSLGLLIATCLKLFLYDLSYLDDLYRVLSVAGLAVSLIAVSFAYKRFVFTEPESAN